MSRRRYCHYHSRYACPDCLAATPGPVGGAFRAARFVVALFWTFVGIVIIVGILAALIGSVV